MTTFSHKAVKSNLATISKSRYLAPHDPSKAGIDTQIPALTASIHKSLRHIAGLVKRNRMDQAALECMLVSHKRSTLHNLVSKREELQAQEPVPMAKPGEPRNATKTKRKSYKRWSDK